MTRQAALLAALAAALVDVQASMVRRMGDATACQLHKDGRVTGGLKYDEGRLVALINLQRAVRTAESTNGAALDAAIAGERQTWQQLLDLHRLAERPSLPWVAYAQGGVDAIDDLP